MSTPPEERARIAALLADSPPGERALLELEARCSEPAGPGRIAAALRLFALSWDPLGWLPERGEAWATANGDGYTWELVVYSTLEGTEGAEGAVDRLEELAQVAMINGLGHEQLLVSGAYPVLAARGEAPRLLERREAISAIDRPALRARTGNWEPIGLGAIQDLVQDAFGPVDLDRSGVRLTAGGPRKPGCPACAGKRFGFPGELSDETPRMCRRHRRKSEALTARRLARAKASNPDGWEAMTKASARLHDLPDPPAR